MVLTQTAATITVEGIEVPLDVGTLEGFRAWVATLPESGPRPRATFCEGRVHVEMSPQDYRSHAPLTVEVTRVLSTLARELNLGMYFTAPSWLTDVAASLSTEPDGFLVRWSSFQSGRVRINPARAHELLGAPDMAFEAVSKTSTRKDQRDLVEAYARAGTAEYWIADAREGTELSVLVLDAATRRYVQQTPDADGWTASPTWGRLVRLVEWTNPAGLRDWRLELRPQG